MNVINLYSARKNLTSLSLIIVSLYSSTAFTSSLDNAVNAQLATGPLPCAELLAGFADNTDRLTGGLLDICSAAVPAGSAASSTGGGSASPISAPTVMTEFVNIAHGNDAKNNDSNAISTKINSQWNLFFTLETESLDRDVTEFESGYSSDLQRVIGGMTFSANPNLVFSLAFDFSNRKGDFTDGGDFEQDSRGIRFLSSFRPNDQSFISLLAGFDSISAQHQRDSSFSFLFNSSPIYSTTGTPTAGYDYNQLGLGIFTGYEYQSGRYSFTPQLGLNWTKADYGTYRETGNSGLELTFYDDEKESLQGTIGFTSSASFNTSFGTINPQLGLTWHHEFKNDQHTAEVSFTGDAFAERFTYQTDDPDRDFFNVSAGLVLIFKNGLQGFVNLQAMVDHDYYDNYIASIGLRKEL